MPLIRCPDCAAQVSNSAPACPSCGYPVARLTNLVDAVRSGNASLVTDLIKSGVDVNAKDLKERTALMIAASKANLEMVQILIQAGADAGYVNSSRETALTIASKKRNKEIARVLRQALIQGVTSIRKKNQLASNTFADETAVMPCMESIVDIVREDLELLKSHDQAQALSVDLQQADSVISTSETATMPEEEAPPSNMEQKTTATIEDADDGLYCMECGRGIHAEDIQCSRCGALIVRRYCSHCSKLIPAHASICTFCGHKGTQDFRYSPHPESKWIGGMIAILFVVMLLVIWRFPSKENDPTQVASVSEPALEPKPVPRDTVVHTAPPPSEIEVRKEPEIKNSPDIREQPIPKNSDPGTKQVPAPAPAKPLPETTEPSIEEEWEAAVTNPDGSNLSREERERRGRKLNNKGFTLMRSGQVTEAIPLLEQSVRSFPKDTKDPYYAYALFNLARALRITGRPDLAIPLLERRIKINDQREVVARELQIARRQAGQPASDSIQYQ